MHSKIRHNLHIPTPVSHEEMDSRYKSAHDGHDSGIMTHKEMDRRDPHMKPSEPKPEQTPTPEGESY